MFLCYRKVQHVPFSLYNVHSILNFSAQIMQYCPELTYTNVLCFTSIKDLLWDILQILVFAADVRL